MSLPFPVRLTDMEAVEASYRAASAERRLALHGELPFYELLEDGERIVLERRYPNELVEEPTTASPLGVRVAWDFRSRELVVAMLSYGDLVLAGKLDLVGSVAADHDAAVLALTATGSVVELSSPDESGARAWVYRPSIRQRGHRRQGTDPLTAPVKLGNRLQLGGLRTSELLVIAAGPGLPDPDGVAARHGSMLFSPDGDTLEDGAPDEVRVAVTRYRVLVDAAGNASDEDRAELQERIIALAAQIQRTLAPQGGIPLSDVGSLVTSSGSRYEVSVAEDGRVDLTRHAAGGERAVTQYADAEIKGQTVVKGAPLVIEHVPFAGRRVCSYIFRVAAITSR